jgi:tetratricopeptide (TPR) repeat protein
LIELNLDDPFSWNHRGVAYARLGDWDRSAADHTKAIELKPGVGAYWANRAYAHLKLGLGDKARADCAKATGLVGGDPQACVALGNIELGLQQWDEAFQHFAKVIQMKPDDAAALDGAIAACRKLTALRPNDLNVWYWLAQAHLTAGDRAEYRRVCADTLIRFGKTKDPGVAARVLYTCLPTPDALDDMSELLPLAKLAATNTGNARVLGAAFYRSGKYQEAIEPLKLGQSRAWDHLFLAMAHYRLDQIDKARDYLNRATEQLNPNNYAWPERVESEHLRREAEALINGTDTAVPAVKKQ